MRRSYLNIKENNFKIFEDKAIYNADGLMIDVYDASCLFSNFTKYEEMFAKLEENNTKIYLKVDQDQISKGKKAIDQTIGKYISGFAFHNPTPRVLRKLSLKARDYELRQKLNFKSINFTVYLDSLNSYLDIKKIMNNSRVKYIILGKFPASEHDYIVSKITALASEYKKTIINPDQITYSTSELTAINEKYTPSVEEINKALVFANKFKAALHNDRKDLLAEESLVRNYQVLSIAERLGIIDDYPKVNFIVKKKQEHIITKEPHIRSFYTLGEEIGNAVTHGVGAALSITGLILLIIKGLRGERYELMSYIIFAVSAIILYLMSTLYHSMAMETKAKQIFRKLDHITIYLLIAGTYTPFSLLAIGGETGLWIFIGLWATAFIGTLLNIFAFGKFRALHMILYLGMGWVAIFFMPQIIASMDTLGVIFLIVGGVMYTLGVLFYGLKLFKYTHMVWHIFVIFGTVFHFFAIYYFL